MYSVGIDLGTSFAAAAVARDGELEMVRLGGQATVQMKPVKTSEKAEDMLRFDLDNESETVRNYRERVRQCEALGEYAIAEDIREILRQEQEHQTDLATALGEDVPDVSR